MSKPFFPAVTFVHTAILAVSRIAGSIFARRETEDEIILEVRLDHVEALAA